MEKTKIINNEIKEIIEEIIEEDYECILTDERFKNLCLNTHRDHIIEYYKIFDKYLNYDNNFIYHCPCGSYVKYNELLNHLETGNHTEEFDKDILFH